MFKKIGLRTIKTGIAVTLSLLVSTLLTYYDVIHIAKTPEKYLFVPSQISNVAFFV